MPTQPEYEPIEAGPEEDDFSLTEFLRVMLQHRALILAFTLGFLVLSALYAFFWPPTFEAVTTVKTPESSQSTQNAIREMAFMPTSGDPIETYTAIAKSNAVADYTLKALGLKSLPDNRDKTDQALIRGLLKTVTITNVKKSNLLSIAAKSGDPQMAADLANTWARGFIRLNMELARESALTRYQFIHDQLSDMKKKMELNKSAKKYYLNPSSEVEADEVIYKMLLEKDQEAQIAAKAEDPGIVVVDKAPLPDKPIWPKKIHCLALGLFSGLFLGFIAAFFIEKIQDHVKSGEDMKRVTGLPNYAVVPDFREDYPQGLSPPGPSERFSTKSLINNPVFQHAFYRESFKVLRTNLTYAQADGPLKALMAVSPGPEEGKTLVNANLAMSLAQAGKKTLLVDADMRKSSVRRIFGLQDKAETGLPLALTGQKSWRSMVKRSGVENLDLLPNTVHPPDPAELLGSNAMKKLIGELKEAYDYVVFDAPPVLPVTDAVVLSTLLDGVVLMARFDMTRCVTVSHALEHLNRVGAKVLGSVLNCVAFRKAMYGYGYGYSYGYGYGKYKYHEEEGQAGKGETPQPMKNKKDSQEPH